MSSSRPIGLTPKQFGATNALVTLAAMSFLVWVVYFHEGNGAASTHQPRAAFRGDVPDDSDVILPGTEQPSRNPSPPILVDVGGVDVRVGHRSRGLFHAPRDPLVEGAGRLHDAQGVESA